MEYRTPPAISGVEIGLTAEQELDDVGVAFAGGDMEGSAAIQIDAVNVGAVVEQVLDSPDVTSAGHEQQLHGGVQILRHRELVVVVGTSADGVKRRLPPEAEAEIVPPRVKRRLPRELPAQRPP